MEGDENTTQTAAPGTPVLSEPTPLVDPSTDFSGATITPIANDPPSDDAPHAPTEAEGADLGRPLEPGETMTSGAGLGSSHTFAKTFADRDSALDATQVMTSTSSGGSEPQFTEEQLASFRAQRERDQRKWKWVSALSSGQLAGVHPNIVEAMKALEKAEAEWDRAMKNIDGQHLKSLELAGDDAATQADAVRELMDPRY